eukprot:gene24687-biopygen19442
MGGEVSSPLPLCPLKGGSAKSTGRGSLLACRCSSSGGVHSGVYLPLRDGVFGEFCGERIKRPQSPDLRAAIRTAPDARKVEHDDTDGLWEQFSFPTAVSGHTLSSFLASGWRERKKLATLQQVANIR